MLKSIRRHLVSIAMVQHFHIRKKITIALGESEMRTHTECAAMAAKSDVPQRHTKNTEFYMILIDKLFRN